MSFTDFRIFESSITRFLRRLKDSRRLLAVTTAFLLFSLSSAPAETAKTSWTERTLRRMTLREKIAQLVQIRVPGKFLNRQNPDYLQIVDQIRRNHVGGLVLFAGNIYESAILLNDLQAASKLPLIVSADFERGASFRIADTTSFPWTMALGAAGSEDLAYQQGLITAQESRALGVHWIFAPVMDVNNNPDNPVINIRSFGEDPNLVARLGGAFIRGAQKGGVLTTAKHFPGHGDTAVDSHVGLPVVEADMTRLESVEFIPFRSAIDAGVDSIMTAHVAVPRVTGEAKTPATLSPAILTQTLRKTLKFKGLVVTDALEMAGITDRYGCGPAAVRALQAGADVLLLPPDSTVAINAVERAVKRGAISIARINASVRKILDAKSRLKLNRNRLASLQEIGDVIASPQSVALAQDIANRAITVIKDDQHVLPISALTDKKIFSLVLSSDNDSSPGASFQNEMNRRYASIRTAWVNTRISEDLLADIDRSIANADIIVCATLSRLITGQAKAAGSDHLQQIIRKVLAAQKPVVWVALGNPYLLRLVPQLETYVCSFSYSENSQIAAARAIAGEIPVSGKMPVSVPGIAQIGAGLDIPQLYRKLKAAPPEELGLAADAFAKTAQLLSALIEDRTLPGAQLVIGYKGKFARQLALGKSGFAAGAQPVSASTIFPLSSIALPAGITMAALPAVDSGKLLLDARADSYLAELADTQDGTARIQDLLQSIAIQDGTGARAKAAAQLEKILEQAAGKPWYPFMSEQVLAPLGMKNTLPSLPAKQSSVSKTAAAESFDLFSTSEDMSALAQMLLNRGSYNDYRVAGFKTMAKFTGAGSPWSKPTGDSGLLSSSSFGCNASNGSFFWVDPAKELFFILLTDGRRDDARIPEAQRKLQDSILAAFPK